MSDAEISQLNAWALGLHVLAALPLPWQQRCSALHEQPLLILEVLFMCKQLDSASQIMKEFPSLRDNNLILAYAAKAIAVNMNPPVSEQRAPMVVPRTRQKTQTGMPAKSNFSHGFSNLQKEARHAFSWTPRDSGTKSNWKEPYRKRKSLGLPPSANTSWEAMANIQEDRSSVNALDGQKRFPSIATSERWVLTEPNHSFLVVHNDGEDDLHANITITGSSFQQVKQLKQHGKLKVILPGVGSEVSKAILNVGNGECVLQRKQSLNNIFQDLPLNASLVTPTYGAYFLAFAVLTVGGTSLL
ncbi:uncharacterized protein LOC116255704 isoform X2 [Nymphaea colorata]|nr:uncharacterized protein LOC116255704 isoform X2 [Nymphaea colorata]